MGQNREDKYGTVRISDEVISICAVNAVLKTNGVHELSGGLIDNLSKNILGNEPPSKGIKISRDENNVEIDVFIIVDYEVKIPAVAWEVQVNVKNEVEQMTGLSVTAVNIHVQGVHLPDEEEI